MAGQILPHDVHGTGPARVIVLHNWFADRSSFDAFRAHADPEAHTYAFLDCRGYGDAIDAEGAYTMEEVAEDALAVADHLGWDEFSVLGHSMGGKAAQWMLLRAPGRIRSLIGVAPVPAAGFPFDEQSWELFSKAAEEPGNRRVIIDHTTGGRHDDAWLDAMVERSLARSSQTAFRAYLDSWSGTDFHEQIKGNPTPVLLVAGAHDPALGAATMEATWLQWYPNARLEVFDEAGHHAPEETPAELATVVERFLAN
ncbi:alpha/beta fold hydrolase [Streptomyces tritici]|uniref:alpha/beta fold hydrolase n=1 Tax=Streptomyces tritici TaxID=2054410 RepID=UPI003AF02070